VFDGCIGIASAPVLLLLPQTAPGSARGYSDS